jgi:serine protease Do
MTTPSKKSFAWWPIVRTVILALSAGAGAGIVSAVWTSQALEQYAERLRGAIGIPRVTTDVPSPIPGTYEEALARVQERSRASVAMLLPKTTDGTVPSTWVSASDALAYGAIVSDDGWVAFDASAFAEVRSPEAETDVWIAQKRYAITKVIRDEATSLALIRVEAKNSVSMDFAVTDSVPSGVMMFAVDGSSVTVDPVIEANAIIDNGVLPAETFTTDWQLAQSVPLSMPLVNAAGNLAGFVRAGEATALPLHHVLREVRETVKSGESRAAVLGAYTVDLAQTFGIDSAERQQAQAGALVVAPNTFTRAVVAKGPAANAGVALGDIILAVDGETITEKTSLAEVLSTYSPGNTARLTIYRGGETVTLSVTLGDQTSVVY